MAESKPCFLCGDSKKDKGICSDCVTQCYMNNGKTLMALLQIESKKRADNFRFNEMKGKTLREQLLCF